MATLLLSNFPDSLYETLERRAKVHRRTVDEEAMAAIKQVMEPKRVMREAQIKQVLADTKTARAQMTRFMSDAEISTAISEGRS